MILLGHLVLAYNAAVSDETAVIRLAIADRAKEVHYYRKPQPKVEFRPSWSELRDVPTFEERVDGRVESVNAMMERIRIRLSESGIKNPDKVVSKKRWSGDDLENYRELKREKGLLDKVIISIRANQIDAPILNFPPKELGPLIHISEKADAEFAYPTFSPDRKYAFVDISFQQDSMLKGTSYLMRKQNGAWKILDYVQSPRNWSWCGLAPSPLPRGDGRNPIK